MNQRTKLLEYLQEYTTPDEPRSNKEIKILLGYSDTRCIRADREKLQREGYHVCTCKNGLYYEPDVNKWVANLRQELVTKATSLFTTYRMARRKAGNEKNYKLELK